MGKVFLILVHSYTKWMEIRLLQLRNYGKQVIVSDNGHPFTSTELQLFLKQNGIIPKGVQYITLLQMTLQNEVSKLSKMK